MCVVTTTMHTLYMWHEVRIHCAFVLYSKLFPALRDMHVDDGNSIWKFYSLVISIVFDPLIVLSLSFSLASFS